MDEPTVRSEAQAHGDAIVAGDLKRAMEYLTPEAQAIAGRDIGPRLPRPVKGADITSVEPAGESFQVTIRYLGDGTELVVSSRWDETEGRPMITDLSAV